MSILMKNIRLISMLLLCASVQAASFDCTKAQSNVEKIICAKSDLSELDEKLAVIYKAALTDETQAVNIRQAQKRWLKERNSCGEADCLMSAYQRRIEELRSSDHADALSPLDAAPATQETRRGMYVLRATRGLGDSANYKGFCTSFTANLNEFRNLDFGACNPRLSPKYSRFSRPRWEQVSLDMDMVKNILANRPSVGYARWLRIYDSALAANEVKMWSTEVDLLKDGNLDRLIRLDHASDGTQPYCSYFDSRQMVVDIPDSDASRWYARAHFDNHEQLGGDMIYDAETKRYFALNWNRYTEAIGGGITPSRIGATASLTISGANKDGIWPVCWIDWVPNIDAGTAH